MAKDRKRFPGTRINCIRCGKFFYSLNYHDERCHRCPERRHECARPFTNYP